MELTEGGELLLLVPDARASVSDDAKALWPLTLAHPNFYRAPSSARVDSALIQIRPHESTARTSSACVDHEAREAAVLPSLEHNLKVAAKRSARLLGQIVTH